jgi:hypothetical protein
MKEDLRHSPQRHCTVQSVLVNRQRRIRATLLRQAACANSIRLWYSNFWGTGLSTLRAR